QLRRSFLPATRDYQSFFCFSRLLMTWYRMPSQSQNFATTADFGKFWRVIVYKEETHLKMKTFSRPRRGVTGAISFAASISLGLAAHSGNTPLAPAFEAGIGTHKTRAEIPNANKVTARIETVSVAAPTRSNFKATWESMSC